MLKRPPMLDLLGFIFRRQIWQFGYKLKTKDVVTAKEGKNRIFHTIPLHIERMGIEEAIQVICIDVWEADVPGVGLQMVSVLNW